MLLRLAYLAVTNTFTLLRLLPMSERDKDIEILALRHQMLVLQRQAGKAAFTNTDRALLAGLLHHLPMDKLRQLPLLVRPDTILRWHRDLLKRRHAATCAPKRRGRPPTVRSIRTLVLRLARENSSWGYRRIHGELAALGIKVAASTVWETLREHGIPPAPERQSTTWADFLHSQADALLACDFLRDPHPDRGASVRLRRHRARRQAHPDPRRYCASDRSLGGAVGAQSRHGPGGRGRKGDVLDP